ncbi:2-oxoacid:ferredoxin oxidoreductase subunit beta [Candidatus Woesearchaeota archaeon]|nr:2-oxoacid:ferredoxin oxidoreductase subunit beta [Candidatus Woesearchaeota archaeon]
MTEIKDYTQGKITWCAGCGDFSILNAVKRAFVELNIQPENLAFTSGIGCSSKISYWTKAYGFSGLHGRGLQLALGAKLANRNLTVFSAAGDGDLLGEGVNHLIHTARKNIDVTLILHNNQVYGLTTGQKSPTSEKGFITISTPKGVVEDPLNPLLLALTSGSTFIARCFAGDLNHITKIIAEGIKHKGFSFIEILQPCVTYNYLNTYDYWKERCYDLQQNKYDFTNKEEAFKKMHEYGKKMPVGIFYKINKPSYEELFKQTKIPSYKHNIDNINIDKLFEEFR